MSPAPGDWTSLHRRNIYNAVRDEGPLAVLAMLIDAVEVAATRLDQRGDVIGARETRKRRKDPLQKALNTMRED